MTTKHTPGPWVVAERGNTFHTLVIRAGLFGKVADISAKPESDANARLIAAAPELLAACDAAETMLRCLPETTTNANGEKPMMTTLGALALVRAAIAKANGIAP